MPQEGYTSVSVREEDFETAKEYKPSDVDWGGVLMAGAEHLNENLASHAEGYRDQHMADPAEIAAELSERLDVGPGELESDVDLGDIRAELRQLGELIEQSPERVAEELRG